MRIDGKEFDGFVLGHKNDFDPLIALLIDEKKISYDDATRTVTFLDDVTNKATAADPARMEE